MAAPTKRKLTFTRVATHPHAQTLWCLAAHPTRLAAALGGGWHRPHGALWLCEPDGLRPLADTRDPPRALAWATETQLVVVTDSAVDAAHDGTAAVILRAVGSELAERVVATLPYGARDVTLSVDREGRRAMVNTARGAHLVTLDGSAPPRTFGAIGAWSIVGCALSPDGRTALVATLTQREAALYDADTGARLRTLEGMVPAGVVAACFDATGAVVAAVSPQSPMLRVWSVADGALRFERAGSGNPPYALALSPDGAVVAFSEHGRVVLLDARDGRELGVAKAPSGNPLRLAFSHDGSQLLATFGCELHAIALRGEAPAECAQTVAPRGVATLRAGAGLTYMQGAGVDGAGAHWVVGMRGVVLRSRDAGATWEPVKLRARPSLAGVCEGADGVLRLYGDRGVLAQRDGAFEAEPLPKRERVVAMASTPTHTLAASLERVYARPRGDAAWAPAAQPPFEGAWHHQLAVDDAGRVLLASGAMGRGFVAIGDAAGGAWRRAALPDAPYWCVACDGDDVYAGGDGPALWRSDDRGETWRRLDTPAAAERWRSVVARRGTVYLLDARGALLRSDDRGGTWEALHPDGVEALAWTPDGLVLAPGAYALYGIRDPR
jgi:photosystem II stability/assembly factor-like uncharacterized protein